MAFTKPKFKVGMSVRVTPHEKVTNGLITSNKGKVFTIKNTIICLKMASCEGCSGLSLILNEEPLRDTEWCDRSFTPIGRGRTRKTTISNLALPSAKEWRSIIDK